MPLFFYQYGGIFKYSASDVQGNLFQHASYLRQYMLYSYVNKRFGFDAARLI